MGVLQEPQMEIEVFGRYVITRNNPYYPQVEYRETRKEAETVRDEWIRRYLDEGDGGNEILITISQEVETYKMKGYA